MHWIKEIKRPEYETNVTVFKDHIYYTWIFTFTAAMHMHIAAVMNGRVQCLI
jgi:hypothetical protein